MTSKLLFSVSVFFVTAFAGAEVINSKASAANELSGSYLASTLSDAPTADDGDELFDISEGVYTIFNIFGWCLAIQYSANGSLTPFWYEPRQFECIDRIPSYQWVVEKTDDGVKITNREFGSFDSKVVSISGIKIPADGYAKILDGVVKAAYIKIDKQTSCDLPSASGFRPVNSAYTKDPYLGYKHFHVDNDPDSPDFGISQDTENEEGMDAQTFSFNLFNSYANSYYITHKSSHEEEMLNVIGNSEDKTDFAFGLPTCFRSDYLTELYGYPDIGRDKTKEYTMTVAVDDEGGKTQTVAQLERYYYELTVPAVKPALGPSGNTYVVLKGGTADDGSSVANFMSYGLAEVYDDTSNFKLANIYLHETYFVETAIKAGEKRKVQDPSRKVYYAVMDRVEEKTAELLYDYGYGDLPDSLKDKDDESWFTFVGWILNEMTGQLKAQFKSANTSVTTFALENSNTAPNGNEQVSVTEAVVRYGNNALEVSSAAEEIVYLYSISGASLLQARKQAGAATIPTTALHRGVYIVRGDSGWVRKLIVQ